MPKIFYTDDKQQELLAAVHQAYDKVWSNGGANLVLRPQDVLKVCAELGGWPYPNFLLNPQTKYGAGRYTIAKPREVIPTVLTPAPVRNEVVAEAIDMELAAPDIETTPMLGNSFIPAVDPTYVPFGFFKDLSDIIASRIFYPVYVTGLSGNGKTFMVQQACARTKREFFRVNITKETDEHDLIGSYELVNGNTVWNDGPAVIAMKRGAILLLDETDYGSERLLCLQPILEGKPYYNKKRNEVVSPAPGFNIMACANTKGKGSDDGRFIGANTLNEAFLERFAITVEQEYASEQTERKILFTLFDELDKEEKVKGLKGVTPGMKVQEFSQCLSRWAELIRKTYADGAVDEVISTRRLAHICRAYMIFRSRRKALELCLNRFDAEVKTVYLDFYSKIDQNMDAKIVEPVPGTVLQSVTVDGEVLGNAVIAPPVSTPQAKAPSKTPNGNGPAVMPKTAPAAPTATKPAVIAIFGDARDIATVSGKFGTMVKVAFNKSTAEATVESHGMITKVAATDYLNGRKTLEQVVQAHATKMASTGGWTQDDTTVGDDEAPF